MNSSEKTFQVKRQPSPTTCGQTCLHAIYDWYDKEVTLEQVVEAVPTLHEGGTLAVHLGLDALTRGYKSKLYSCNLRVLDPTWFPSKRNLLIEKLADSRQVRTNKKEKIELEALEAFVRHGGKLTMEALTRNLLRKHLKRKEPLLTGLSSTFLYGDKREIPDTGKPDDLAGKPEGHFVVLHGFDQTSNRVTVHDPYPHTPFGVDHCYPIHIDRLINAILLGVLTHDANILVIQT